MTQELIEVYKRIPYSKTDELLKFLKENFKDETRKEMKRLSGIWYLDEMHVFAQVMLGIKSKDWIVPKILLN